MKKLTKLFSLLLCAMLLLSVLPLQSFAAGKIDTEAVCSLTINYTHEQQGIAGAEFEIFRVAAVSADIRFTVEKAFADYPVDFTDMDENRWATLANTLQGYVRKDALTPAASGKTDANGKLVFTDLQPGLYLVLGSHLTVDNKIFKAAPFLICLPFEDKETGEWNYDPIVIPKYSVDEISPVPEKIKIKVLKIWDDEGYKNVRPARISVQLICDNKTYSTVFLSKDNKWSYTWENLDKDHDWSVIETRLDNYTVELKQEGITYTLTNTYEEPPEKPTEPDNPPPIIQTGLLWWPVPVLLGLGIVLIILATVFGKKSEK